MHDAIPAAALAIVIHVTGVKAVVSGNEIVGVTAKKQGAGDDQQQQADCAQRARLQPQRIALAVAGSHLGETRRVITQPAS